MSFSKEKRSRDFVELMQNIAEKHNSYSIEYIVERMYGSLTEKNKSRKTKMLYRKLNPNDTAAHLYATEMLLLIEATDDNSIIEYLARFRNHAIHPISDVGSDSNLPLLGLAKAMEGVGRLAQKYHAAINPGSPGGQGLTPQELDEIEKEAFKLINSVMQFKSQVSQDQQGKCAAPSKIRT